MADDFFIGWQAKPPERTGRFVRRIVIAAVAAALGLAVVLPAFQETVAVEARFEFGEVREFGGILLREPVPMLVGEDGVVYLLVNQLKFGFDPGVAAAHHLRHVRLEGTRIHRGGEEMIEVRAGTVTATADRAAGPHPLGAEQDRGECTLRGEIVDSKCYLGVMNPGTLKPHRACAINCIAGGIPPVLLVRDREGGAAYYLLVGEDGGSLNSQLLDIVAEPVVVTGRLHTLGDRRILRTERSRIRRE